MSRGKENGTGVSEFLLLGITSDPEQRQVLFWLFLCTYLVTVAGNTLIILVIGSDPRLHTPMYFFLTNLSFVDICFTTNLIPKLLVSHVAGTWTISYPHCLTQMYFLISFANLDTLLLAAMALDRYVAICKPLQYHTIITPQLCRGLMALMWTSAGLISLLHTLLMNRLTFCSSARGISHFYCDAYLLMKIACSDTRINQRVFLGAVVLFVAPCAHCGLLRPHSCSRPPDPLRPRKAQGIFHMRFPSVCGHPVLWNCPGGIHTTPQLLLSPGHSSNHHVHSGDPHAKPLHLQPEEPGHEEGCKKTLRQGLQILLAVTSAGLISGEVQVVRK